MVAQSIPFVVPEGSEGSDGPHPPISLHTILSTRESKLACTSESAVGDQANRTKPPGWVCRYQAREIVCPLSIEIGAIVISETVRSQGPAHVGSPSPPYRHPVCVSCWSPREIGLSR